MDIRYVIIEPRSCERARITLELHQKGQIALPFQNADEASESFSACDIVLARDVRGIVAQCLDKMDEVKAWRPIIVMGKFDSPRGVAAYLSQGAVDCVSDNREVHSSVVEGYPYWRNKWQKELERRKTKDVFSCLTDREYQVARHIAAGLSNKASAEIMEISTRTVEAHRSNLLYKTGFPNAITLAIAFVQSQNDDIPVLSQVEMNF